MMIQSSWYQKAPQISSMLAGKGRKFVLNLILPLLIAISILIYSNGYAAESSIHELQDHTYAGVYKHKISGDFTVRGWKLSPNIYFGQTKTFGVTSYGLMIDKGEYAFGVIDQKISIMKSF